MGTHTSNRQRASGHADGGAAHREPRCHCLRRRRHCWLSRRWWLSGHADAWTTTTTRTQKFLRTAQPPRCASAGCSVRGCPSSPLCQTCGETPALVGAAGASSSLTVVGQLNFGPERTHHTPPRAKQCGVHNTNRSTEHHHSCGHAVDCCWAEPAACRQPCCVVGQLQNWM